MTEQQWINLIAEFGSLQVIRDSIEFNIRHGLADFARINTIALVRRLRTLDSVIEGPD